MFCYKCGMELAETAAFCSRCGTQRGSNGKNENTTLWMSAKSFFRNRRRGVGVCLLLVSLLCFIRYINTDKKMKEIEEEAPEFFGTGIHRYTDEQEEELSEYQNAQGVTSLVLLGSLVVGCALLRNPKFKCPKCNKKIARGVAKCRNCGQALRWKEG